MIRGTSRRRRSRVIGALKSLSAIGINRLLDRSGTPVWQRSYHDRIVRNDAEWERLVQYIDENPARWAHKHIAGT